MATHGRHVRGVRAAHAGQAGRRAMNGKPSTSGVFIGGRGALSAVPPPNATTASSKQRQIFHKGRVLRSPLRDEDYLQITGSVSNQSTEEITIDSFVHEKLAFDELLRIQRSRAEDVGKLVAELGAVLGEQTGIILMESEREKNRKAAKYREEWRVGREDDILSKLRVEEDGEVCMSTLDQSRKLNVVRAHVRRSIHLFLTSERSGPRAGEAATTTTKARLSNDLFYAQQMDRLLREMDSHQPFDVVRRAIGDARAKFQQLLTCTNTPLTSLKAIGSTQRSSQPHDCSVGDVDQSTNSETDVLHLYENVVKARGLEKDIAIKPQIYEPAREYLAPRDEFILSLELQRQEAKERENEILARHQWVTICAKRIRHFYLLYRKRMLWNARMKSLQQRVQCRAAMILQTVFLRIIQAYRYRETAKVKLLHKHQGRTIATNCFWRWIYPGRCKRGEFCVDITYLCHYTLSIVLIQSVWRRHKALKELKYLRAVHILVDRRKRRREWRQWRQAKLDTTAINIQIAEWTSHIAIEQARVIREMRREQQRFTSEWAKYETKLQKEVMKSKLPPEWIPQLDPVGGETFYLNIETSKTSTEHPNMTLFKHLVKKQKNRAEELYQARRQRLEQYLEKLDLTNVDEISKLYTELEGCQQTPHQ